MNVYQVEVIIEQSDIHDTYEVCSKSPVKAISRVMKDNEKKYEYSSSFRVEVLLID